MTLRPTEAHQSWPCSGASDAYIEAVPSLEERRRYSTSLSTGFSIRGYVTDESATAVIVPMTAQHVSVGRVQQSLLEKAGGDHRDEPMREVDRVRRVAEK